MIEREVVVSNRLGVHSRVASELARIALDYGSVYMVRHDEIIDCSSALEVLSLGLAYGAKITIRTDGDLKKEAMAAVEVLLNRREDP
ncbi:MAG: HPr family phosphocarrier protein [Desulfobulbaceae bacterium]|nr:HPr family phosphocarrier protein [Desulfobulbaceae bacterium]